MTLQLECGCGTKFYISLAEENAVTFAFARERYHEFLATHKTYCTQKPILEELPEDWKV